MEKYEPVEIEIIEFGDEDVITYSDPITPEVPINLSEDTLFSAIWNETDE